MSAPNMHVKASAVWKRVAGVHTRAGGVWKRVRRVWVRQGGAWRLTYQYRWIYTMNIVGSRGQVVISPGYLTTQGWDGTSPVDVRVSVSAGVTVSAPASSNFGGGAFIVTGIFPGYSSLLLTNRGKLRGGGGAGGSNANAPYLGGYDGGTGLDVSGSSGLVISVDNSTGELVGGGGGGGGVFDTSIPGATVACGGGGGAGSPGGAGGERGGGFYGGAGTDGTVTDGGAGYKQNAGVYGGTGGDPGQAGRDGSGTNAGPGGAAGAAVLGNGKITWIAIGTRYGAIA